MQKGHRGDLVKLWQDFLISEGFLRGKSDKIFGNGTAAATAAFQLAHGLRGDGVVGHYTLLAARKEGFSMITARDSELANAAGLNHPAIIVAFRQVESLGDPRATRFEPHVFLRARPDLRGKVPYTPDPKYNYSTKRKETDWKAFSHAFELDAEQAVKSTSWGSYQVLGGHLLALYPNPLQAVEIFQLQPEKISDEIVVAWFKANPLAVQAANEQKWDLLAKYYNGRNYAVHGYHTRLAAAFSLAA